MKGAITDATRNTAVTILTRTAKSLVQQRNAIDAELESTIAALTELAPPEKAPAKVAPNKV